MGETSDLLEDGFFDRPTTRLNRSARWKLYLPDKNGEFCGSKDTSKRGHNISANRGRLDSLDDKRGRHQLSRPESKHQTRRPRTLRDILRPRSTVRFQGNRRLQDTRTRVDEEPVRRMESTTPVSKREKTQDTCQHAFRES